MEGVFGIRRRREFWICIGLACATIAAYSQVHRHHFIDFDDGEYVFENYHVAKGLSLDGVAWALTTGHSSNWHPLTWLSHMADCQVFGLNPGPQHLVSVLFHVVNALLLFVVLRNLTGALWRSAFVAGLFALHPLHVESVAWIAERKDVLSTLFWLLTILAYAHYARKPGLGRYLLALFPFALGLMAKPMLVTLPFVLLLFDFWPLGRIAPLSLTSAGKPMRSGQSLANKYLRPALPLIREKIPFFLLAAASSAVTYAVQKSGGAVKVDDIFPLDTRIANALHSYVAYLVKAAWPAGLSIFYPYPATSYQAWELAAALLCLIGVTALAVRLAARFPYLPVGWFWYLGTLVPVIGVVQVGWQAMADRYTYVPLIGIFMVVAWGFPDLFARWPRAKRSLAAFGAVALVGFAVVAGFQVRHWQDTISLFSHALAVNSENYLAHENIGTALAQRGKYQEAVAHFSEALRLRRRNPDTLSNRGYALYRLGKVEDALKDYSSALSISPEHPFALRNMGMALYDQGRFEEAVEFFHKSQRVMPDNPLLCYSLANALAKLGRDQEAIDAYNRVLQMQPDYAEAYFGVGSVLASKGRTAEAALNFEKALELKPEYPEAHNNLGIVLFKQGQTDRALTHYSEALKLKPDYAEGHYNMGVALYSRGKQLEAVNHYREAIRLNPHYADAFYNLGTALDDRGDVQGAAAQYAEAIRLKPDYVEAYNNLGVALFKLGQVQRALDAFSQALRLNPDHAAARRNRDLILGGLGQLKRKP
jgi:Flp pilus assembly protein TadD